MEDEGGTAGSGIGDESGYLSDESSFYGDEKTKSDFESRARDVQPAKFWVSQQRSLQWIAAQNRSATSTKAAQAQGQQNMPSSRSEIKQGSSSDGSPVLKDDLDLDNKPPPRDSDPDPDLHNPWEGDEMAKQLKESLTDFLSRLNPSTTPRSQGSWIWVANPHPHPSRGRHDIAGFKEAGNRLLENHLRRRREIESQHPDKSAGVITNLMKPAASVLQHEILELARARNISHGKWMLFPVPSDVDRLWSLVAQATDDGELGVGAKVATAADEADEADDHGDTATHTKRQNRSQLICIYTADISDRRDVKRVLQTLKRLGLFDAGAGSNRGIFYKSEAYTFLDIVNDNPYKLRASMYGSREMLWEN